MRLVEHKSEGICPFTHLTDTTEALCVCPPIPPRRVSLQPALSVGGAPSTALKVAYASTPAHRRARVTAEQQPTCNHTAFAKPEPEASEARDTTQQR